MVSATLFACVSNHTLTFCKNLISKLLVHKTGILLTADVWSIFFMSVHGGTVNTVFIHISLVLKDKLTHCHVIYNFSCQCHAHIVCLGSCMPLVVSSVSDALIKLCSNVSICCNISCGIMQIFFLILAQMSSQLAIHVCNMCLYI